jgi:hypothetical protein
VRQLYVGPHGVLYATMRDTTGSVTPVSAVDDVINLFRQKRRSLRCSEATQELERLRFRVRAGSQGGHRVVSHPELEGFRGTSFNGGHGADDEVRPGYPGKLIRVLEEHKEALERLLEHHHE